MCFPGCKLLADLGHEVWFECPEKYRSIFDAVTYVRWAAPGAVTADKILDCTLGNGLEASRIADIVYNRHLDIAPSKGRLPAFDNQVEADYGLPSDYVLCAPFSYSVPAPPLGWILEKIESIMGNLEGVFGLADRPVPGERIPFITAKELSHLPGLIRKARAFFTVNTGVDVIASGVRETYHHIYTNHMGGRCNYDAPNQVVILPDGIAFEDVVPLDAAIKEIHPRRILEVGVCPGDNTARMIRSAQAFVANPGGIDYYGFDLFADPPAYEFDTTKVIHKDGIMAKLRSTGANVVLVSGDTRQTLPEFVASKPAAMDLIHIDGGHSIETVRSDWEACRRLIDKGSIVVFDDYWDRLDCGARSVIDKIDRNEYSVGMFKGGHVPGDERLAPSYVVKTAIVRRRSER